MHNLIPSKETRRIATYCGVLTSIVLAVWVLSARKKYNDLEKKGVVATATVTSQTKKPCSDNPSTYNPYTCHLLDLTFTTQSKELVKSSRTIRLYENRNHKLDKTVEVRYRPRDPKFFVTEFEIAKDKVDFSRFEEYNQVQIALFELFVSLFFTALTIFWPYKPNKESKIVSEGARSPEADAIVFAARGIYVRDTVNHGVTIVALVGFWTFCGFIAMMFMEEYGPPTSTYILIGTLTLLSYATKLGTRDWRHMTSIRKKTEQVLWHELCFDSKGIYIAPLLIEDKFPWQLEASDPYLFLPWRHVLWAKTSTRLTGPLDYIGIEIKTKQRENPQQMTSYIINVSWFPDSKIPEIFAAINTFKPGIIK